MNNPYGHYRRHNTPAAEHMAALWKEVAREHAARSSSARRYARACHDSMDAAIRRANKAERALASAEFDAATYRADRDAAEEERDEAVQERDELRQTRRRLLGKVDQLEVKLRNSGSSGEQPRALTAREHLAAAWEAAHVPEDGTIPAGAEYVYRLEDGRVQQGGAASFARDATEHMMERRLLDPPAPSRPDGAEEIEAYMREMVASHPEDHYGELADHLASRGVRVATAKEARHATDE